MTAKEAKQTDGEDIKDDIRFAFDLRFVRRQYNETQTINTSKMANNTFIDTTFDGLEDFLNIGTAG